MSISQEEKIFRIMKSHKHSRTKITDASITDLQIKMGWLGTGSRQDPIVINNVSGLKPSLWIHKSSMYYIIRDIIVYKLICTKTQNITIENCKIHELEVEGCYNMTIRNNSILWLKFLYSKGITLENNTFSNEVLVKLEGNYFDMIYPKIQSSLIIVALILASVASLILFYNLFLWFLSLLTYGLVVIIFYYIQALKAKKNRTVEMLDNVMIENKTFKNSEYQNNSHEILENYSYLKINWFRGYLYAFIGIPVGVTVGVILAMIVYF